MPGEQARQITRVDNVIGGIVCEFVNGRIGSKFHMEDLLGYVQARSIVAPDSPSRILRLQRRAGNLGYVVTNRRESEYLACPPVRPEEQPDA